MISLALASIRLDGGTQCRAKLDDEHIASLAEAWADGAKMPAIVVFHDGSNHWLADGFHRYHAAEKCSFRDILADVRSGTKLEAIRFALSANAAHGLRRTNADKRRAVEIALKEFPKLSDRQIAEICAVGNQLVGHTRKDVCDSHTSATRTDSLGREQPAHKLPARKPAPVKTVEPAPEAGPIGRVVNFPSRANAPFDFEEWKAQMRLSLSFALRRVPKPLLADAERFLAAEVRVFSVQTKHETAHQSVS
jgi:hypothetical protein